MFYRDRNFGGMGETFDLTLTTKPLKHESNWVASPRFDVHWSDCPIGKTSRVSFSGFHSLDLHKVFNLLQVSRASELLKDCRLGLKKVWTSILGANVCFERYGVDN